MKRFQDKGQRTKAMPQNVKGHKREKRGQFRRVGVTALGIKGIVLDEVDGNIFVEGGDDVFGYVEGCHEGITNEEEVSCRIQESAGGRAVGVEERNQGTYKIWR